MNISYSWEVISLYKTTINELDDVVVKVRFNYLGQDNDTGKSSVYSTEFELPSPTPELFVPFNQLTEAQVIGWLNDNINTEHLNVRIERDIEKQNSTVEEVTIMPWN